MKPKVVVLPQFQLLQLQERIRREQRKALLRGRKKKIGGPKAWKLKDEAKKLHLINERGERSAVMSLRCANQECKRRHPESPAALAYWKYLLDRNRLRCKCGSKNFVRTDSKTPQGELISEIIEKKGKRLKEQIEDEVGGVEEGKYYEKKYGVKIK